MKITVLISSLCIMISCLNSNNYIIIPNKGVGNFIINKSAKNKNVSPSELHLQFEKGKYLRSIVVFSDKYYTADGIRVGMKLDELVQKCGKPVLSKKIDIVSGDYVISPLSDVFIYDGIAYVYDRHKTIIAIYIFNDKVR